MLTWKPLAPGEPATPLSLTADEGTWIKLPDFKGHLNVLLVFVRSLDSAETDRYCRELEADRARFEALDTAIFAVHTSRTDVLRAYRQKLGLGFYLLYDPLALAARGFRASGRVRPLTKDNVVLVGKDGKVVLAERGRPPVEKLLEAVARAEGKEVPPPPRPPEPSTVRDPGKGPAPVVDIESDHALKLLEEADSPYVLVDVRTKGEFERERSPRARHIPVDELPHRYAELGQTTHLIFVCQGGGRSAAAAEFMSSIGASQIFNVLGGMSEWKGPKVGGVAGGA
ncbi:MAG: rhodanese-like domain-containing protein [Myxococcota bacterium]